MSVMRRMLAGSVWVAAGSVVSRAAGLVSAILVARMLGAQAFGEFSLVRSTVMTILTFGSVGIGVTATRYIARHRHMGSNLVTGIVNDLTSSAVLAGVIAAGLLLLLAPLVADEVLAAPSLTPYLQIAAVVVFFNALNSFQSGILAGFESFRSIASINALNGLLTIVCVVAGAWIAGVFGAIAGMTIAAAGTLLPGWGMCRDCIRALSKDDSTTSVVKIVSSREMMGFAIPIILSGLLVTPVLWICNAVLVRSADGMHQVALFEAANQWRMLILFVPTLIAQVSLPVFSSIAGTNEFRKTLWTNIGATFILSLAVAGVLIPMADIALGFYGAEFKGNADVLQWLAISGVMMAVNNIVGQAVSSLGKAWHGFLLNFVWAVSIVFLTIKFVEHGMGAKGAAIAQCYAFAIHSVLQIIYVYVIAPKRLTPIAVTAQG